MEVKNFEKKYICDSAACTGVQVWVVFKHHGYVIVDLIEKVHECDCLLKLLIVYIFFDSYKVLNLIAV